MGVDMLLLDAKVYGDSGSNQCAMVENLETLTEGRPCMSLVDLMSQPPTQTNV